MPMAMTMIPFFHYHFCFNDESFAIVYSFFAKTITP